MNGIPVYPHPKNGERPYLAVPEPVFSGLFLGVFWGYRQPVPGIFDLVPPIPTNPSASCSNFPISFYFYFNER